MPCQSTCMSQTTPPAARARRGPSLVVRAAGLLCKGWHAYWDWRARKITILILSSLDRRTLHDIGVTPGEIETLVQGNDGRRRYDAAWLWRSGRREPRGSAQPAACAKRSERRVTG